VQMQDVESSQILQIGYDPETLKARVLFKKKDGTPGSTYEYDNVPKEVIDGILTADSVGRAFASSLKFGFAYHKL
jgi:hypothetical protein